MGGELENLPGETVLKLKVMNNILHNISIPLGHLVFALPAVLPGPTHSGVFV